MPNEWWKWWRVTWGPELRLAARTMGSMGGRRRALSVESGLDAEAEGANWAWCGKEEGMAVRASSSSRSPWVTEE